MEYVYLTIYRLLYISREIGGRLHIDIKERISRIIKEISRTAFMLPANIQEEKV